ncbi:MAG: hypothetical protein WA821_02580 [Anaerolineales bacterium]
MSKKKILVLLGALILAAVLLTACAPQPGPAGPAGPAGPSGPAGPAGPAGADGKSATTADLTCTQCHNNTNLITGKLTAWSTSVHGSGAAFAHASPSAACVGCHTGNGFSTLIAAGTSNTAGATTADPNPTRIDCRACHNIHTTYTASDWSLKTVAPVKLIASGATYDGGMGNLCANCHQQRTAFPAATAGKVKVDSTHWGGHHGPETALILGVGGADLTGKPAAHYTAVKDTCVTCHLGGAGPNASHSFVPNVATCVQCHADAKSLDVNGVQTTITGKLAKVVTALQAKKLLDKDGNIIVGEYPEAQAAALWNYLLVKEDKSLGVHNADYANALLDAALAALK